MRAATNLRAVGSGPEEPPKDITGLLRADIAKRDWNRVHILADNRSPLFIADQRKRTWRG